MTANMLLLRRGACEWFIGTQRGEMQRVPRGDGCYRVASFGSLIIALAT
jgi:hypothetical protein